MAKKMSEATFWKKAKLCAEQRPFCISKADQIRQRYTHDCLVVAVARFVAGNPKESYEQVGHETAAADIGLDVRFACNIAHVSDCIPNEEDEPTLFKLRQKVLRVLGLKEKRQ